MNDTNPAHIDYYSVVPLFLEMFINGGEKPIAIGTGFPVKEDDGSYIITNWHNVTGRNPENNEPLDKINGLCDPDYLKAWFPLKYEMGIMWGAEKILLRDLDGKQKWIEHHKGRKIDVVAVPFLPDKPIFYLDLHKDYKLKIYPSKAVSIIGYPKGVTSGGKFPIWKKGHIASEFKLDYEGKPVFLIDATTRSGMSGSPVILKESGSCEFENGAIAQGTFERFLGIYSGRIDNTIEIGMVWKPHLIREIIALY